MRVDRDPFRTVHFGGAHLCRGLAGEDQHFGLITETVFRRQAIFAELQGNPAAGAFQRRTAGITVKLRHIQRAFVQQTTVIGRVSHVHHAFGNILVNVLTALIVTHVNHQATILGNGYRSIFMFESAQRRVFDWRRSWIHRVDFDDPAMAVKFIRILRHVKTLVVIRPIALRFADF
ncbi:hypothetical protein D3C73_968990 [compost metagenome]